ncbi:apolipoprotein N-acyltransferase [Denitratisoma sp. agr-D3]
MSAAPFASWGRVLLAAALGAVAVAGFAPFEWWPLPLFSLAALLILWRDASPRRAALLGYGWGLGFFLTGVSWVYVSLHDVGGMALPLAAAATLLFCAYLALFPALVGYLLARLRSGRPWADALLFASLWTATEFLRGYLFTGFPWLALGYAQTPPSPLAGYAPVLGSYGVAWIAAFAAALQAKLIALRAWRPALAPCALLAILAGLGMGLRAVTWTAPVGSPFSVSLLQGNIPQQLKWDPDNLHLSIDSYRRLAAEHPADLTVLPETAIPLFFQQIPLDVLASFVGHGQALVGAALRGNNEQEYSNSALLLGSLSDGGFNVNFYSKRHLVPFGEFIPPGFAGFLQLVNIPLAGFTPGPRQQSPLAWRDQRLMPNICYEDLFGEEIRDALQGENPATVLINLSNTAWFGHSLAQPQHLQIARLRALESGRVMLRATNTGMTAAIEPDGRVSARLEPFTRGALTVMVQGREGRTPYAVWGHLPALALLLAGLAPAWIRRRQAVAKSTRG